MENIIVLILGIAISIIGVINMMGNISTIHSYNRRNVKEEDVFKYGKTVGAGTLTIGIAIILDVILSYLLEGVSFYISIIGVVIGLGLILYGQFKYNKGIF